MQYKIPQNVRREDKIVGPLTLKQLVIAGVGGSISYAIYVIFQPKFPIFIWLPSTLVPALLTLALAFLKINGIPFHKFVLLSAEYFMRPRKRTFIMGSADNYAISIFGENKEKSLKSNTKQEMSKGEKIKNLGEITKMLDSYDTKQKAI